MASLRCLPRAGLAAPLVLGVLSSACSWGRFDDVTASAPIAMLEKPGRLDSGFGVSALTMSSDDRVLLFVGGAIGVSAAATFELGLGESPSTDASTTEYCDGSRGVCFLGAPPAALRRLDLVSEQHDFCFALGLGETPIQGNGIVVRCDDTLLFSYAVPDVYKDHADFSIETRQSDIVSQAADDSDSPWLLVGAASAPLTWFYRYGSVEPEVIMPPGAPPPSYGKLVATSVSGANHLFFVAAPEEDQLFMFRVTDAAAEYIGCLGGTAGFGRAIATGPVLGDDDVPDLVISDKHAVHVFDGATLADLPAATGNVCSLAALPAGGLITSFTCGSTNDVTDCGGSKFGEALAVGDLDGDGDGEVVVGAPGMTVREQAGAGAVLVYDVEERGDLPFTEAKFISSAEENDQLGASLSLPRIGERNIIAAGAPGNGKVALFYCSELVPAELRGARCK